MRISLFFAAFAAALPLFFSSFAEAKPPRVIELSVTRKGFEPERVKVEKGETVTLALTRKEARTCATEIVMPGYGIDKKLPLNERVTVTFTPRKTGEIVYGCAMDQMIGGVITVQ